MTFKYIELSEHSFAKNTIVARIFDTGVLITEKIANILK